MPQIRTLHGTLDFRSYDKEIVVNSLQFSISGDYAVIDLRSSPDSEFEFSAVLELGATAPGYSLVSLTHYPLPNYQDTKVRLSLTRRSMRYLFDKNGSPFVFLSGFWHETYKDDQTDYFFSGLLQAEDAKGSRLTEEDEVKFLAKVQTKLNRN